MINDVLFVDFLRRLEFREDWNKTMIGRRSWYFTFCVSNGLRSSEATAMESELQMIAAKREKLGQNLGVLFGCSA